MKVELYAPDVSVDLNVAVGPRSPVMRSRVFFEDEGDEASDDDEEPNPDDDNGPVGEPRTGLLAASIRMYTLGDLGE